MSDPSQPTGAEPAASQPSPTDAINVPGLASEPITAAAEADLGPQSEAPAPEAVEDEADLAAAAPDEAEADEAALAAGERAEPHRRGRRAAGPQPARPLAPYAVIKTGGKQYRVSVGDRIAVERLDVAAGSEITLDQVLLLGGDGTTRVGTPLLAGVAVTARVDEHLRGEKIVVFKYKPKKRYRRRLGHRQELTRLVITGITG